ncbi:DUF5701 family protein [Streptomyces sp. NPDC048442]|uniref:DUF5701 family protein n=1 Tax=Streptomyces sp. NPDC048442 TaxID=3154823 RepID=UPI003431990B
MTAFDAGTEFDRQVQTLVDLGYPGLAGLSESAFRDLAAPLRAPVVARAEHMAEPEEGRVPFVLVVPRAVVSLEDAVPLTTLASPRRTEPGVIERFFAPGELERFVSLEELAVPEKELYAVFDIDRGEEFCGTVPLEAFKVIEGRGRSVLTIEEGLALLTQFPAALAKNKCWSVAGSRIGDPRVPAFWISKNAPKLGWCWEGNPHTWLGVASAGARNV